MPLASYIAFLLSSALVERDGGNCSLSTSGSTSVSGISAVSRIHGVGFVCQPPGSRRKRRCLNKDTAKRTLLVGRGGVSNTFGKPGGAPPLAIS